MNIVLIGYRCSGKTVIGRAVAERLNRVFVDSDEFLENKAGRSIENIVDEEGWEVFREMEREATKELCGRDRLVIATGGGVVTSEKNVRLLKQNGFIVWLQAGAGILKSRMDRDQGEGKPRPSLTGKDPAEEIGAMLEQRAPFYEGASDIGLDTGKLSVEEAAENIIRMIPHN